MRRSTSRKAHWTSSMDRYLARDNFMVFTEMEVECDVLLQPEPVTVNPCCAGYHPH